ncbi:MAG TPA: peptidoglycan-binding protein [Chitinophagaceae bacterium]|nr:peptidoglycan-binding protein [Chitinophagaceae bacterium]
MESNLLEAALKAGDISKSLFQGSANKDLITELQRLLFELGFKNELQFDNYEADGNYNAATVNAVSAFAIKNKYKSDGTVVTNELAKLILQRHDFLPSMYILWSISISDLRTKKYISKGTRMSVTAIQILLNEKGYGTQLNFSKFGADGSYGPGTRNAVIAYAKDNGIESDGDLLTRPLIDLMLKDINAYYGKNWSDLATNNLPNDESPLVLFEASRFKGQPCRADTSFLPALKKINGYAEQADVFIYVTSSFRTSSNVGGAIVKPATRSNHMAGHAIDMNVVYNNGTRSANSTELGKYPSVAEPVRIFIKSIIDDPDLRWGGNFQARDPVHIDDNLNHDMALWDKRYQAMQKAVQLGA